MESNQERLVALFSQSITGQPLVFAPDNLKHKDLEPADLVWELSDCIILFYMTGTQPGSNSWGKEEKKNKQIDHNIKQAKRWMGLWKQEYNIVGKNEYQDFNIPYSLDRKVVVISIFQNGLLKPVNHKEFAEKHNIALCISLPEQAIELLANFKATPLDFFTIIELMYGDGVFDGEYCKENCLEYIFNYFEIVKSEIKKRFPLKKELADEIFNSLNLFRVNIAGQASNDSFKKGGLDFCYIINDLSSFEFFLLSNSLQEDYTSFGKDVKMYGLGKIELEFYDVIFGFCHVMNFSFIEENFKEAFKINEETNKHVFAILFIHLGDQAVSPLYMTEPRRQSQLFKLLENIDI